MSNEQRVCYNRAWRARNPESCRASKDAELEKRRSDPSYQKNHNTYRSRRNEETLATATKSYTEWSREDDDFIRHNYLTMTDIEIGRRIGRTEAAVASRRHRGLSLSKKKVKESNV